MARISIDRLPDGFIIENGKVVKSNGTWWYNR